MSFENQNLIDEYIGMNESTSHQVVEEIMQEILEKKAKMFDEFMKLCTDGSPVDLMKNLGELYQKGLKL